MKVTMRRFPPSLYELGREPDVRFTLANERTFLAWMRTALAMIAGGVALEALALDLHPGLRLTASLLLLAAGILLAPLAYLEWRRSERAIRLEEPLPGSPLSAAVALVVAAVSTLILLGVLLQ